MKTPRSHYCFIDYNESDDSILIDLARTDPPRNYNYRISTASREDIEKKCNEYWDFVNSEIIRRKMTVASGDEIEKFYDELLTKGSALANHLLTDEVRNTLWYLANNCDVLIIVSSLYNIPWEALYHGRRSKGGAFLSEQCVINRIPRITRNTCTENHAALESENYQRAIFVDPLLEDPEISTSIDSLIEKRGAIKTTTKRRLIEMASECRIIHWLCDNDVECGLRIDDNTFYNSEDAIANNFPRNSIVFLISCSTTRSTSGCASIAADIADYSECTVIASSCDLIQKVGIDIINIIEEFIDKTEMASLSVFDLWKIFTSEITDGGPLSRLPQFKKFLPLFFSIYGNTRALLKGDGHHENGC